MKSGKQNPENRAKNGKSRNLRGIFKYCQFLTQNLDFLAVLTSKSEKLEFFLSRSSIKVEKSQKIDLKKISEKVHFDKNQSFSS